MEKVVHISLKQGNHQMDMNAPTPSDVSVPKTEPTSERHTSAVGVTIAGAGGCGINLARGFYGSNVVEKVALFDTSMTNTRPGESAFIVTNGSGSGSNRAENANDIERVIPQISKEDIGETDVAIVTFSLSGGSGSVIGPLLMREYARRGMRVIGVAVADSSYSVGAKNTLNTLKTIDSICRNNNLRIPMVILSNDSASRGEINNTATIMIGSLLALLTTPVYEVDKNDRLNWIDPSKVVQNNPGIKLIGIWSPEHPINQKLVYGSDSTDMVDSLLILQNNQDEVLDVPHPPARLKKTGFYDKKMNQFVGRVSSDVSSINAIVDNIEQMQNMEKAQKHSYVDRIATSGSDDIVL